MTENPITAEELAELRRLHAEDERCGNGWDVDKDLWAAVPRMLDEIERRDLESKRFFSDAAACWGPQLEAAYKEIERLRRELSDTQRHREKLDCRFVGSYGDVDARHCLDGETKEPCQRCGLEMEVERLRAVIHRTHTTHCTDWPKHSPWCLLYEIEP